LEEAETVSSRLFIVADQKIPFCGTSTELRNAYQCGYLLRVDRTDGTVGGVLELAQSFIPQCTLSDERKDTIKLPVDKHVAAFLKEMIRRKDELGINSYSFAVEQLEDMVLKMIETGEPLHKGIGGGHPAAVEAKVQVGPERHQPENTAESRSAEAEGA
jgi:hypothetical protein